MKIILFKKLISFFVCIAFLLSLCCGCSINGTSLSSSDNSSETSNSGESSSLDTSDRPFTLIYRNNVSLNPLTCNDVYNSVITSLIYENLFVLNNAFEPVPVLVDEYVAVDGKTYLLTIKKDIYFHDGSTMTAEDVAYSIRQASYSSKYSLRLSDFYSATATSEFTLTIVLNKVNYRFLSLLDIPIIKNQSLGSDIPYGTGPYTFISSSSGAQLISFDKYRDAAAIPIDDIRLYNCDDADFVSEFSLGEISLIPVDPTSDSAPQIRIDHDSRYYDTTILQYIGFNQRTYRTLLMNADFRRAVSHAVERDSIVDEIFDGYAVAAPFGIHPTLQFYDKSWNNSADFSLTKLSSILNTLGFEDTNGNGLLEYKFSDGVYEEVAFKMIVNSENTRKVEAAKRICTTLKNIGLNVTLTILEWNEYIHALENGDFDMYYAEAKIGADFNLSEILTQSGQLNYSGITDSKYAELINEYLAASDAAAAKSAAKALADYIYEDSAIIPILFEKSAVLSQRNMVFGITPSQSNILNGFIGGEIK